LEVIGVPTPAKAMENMTKNLTAEERARREQAEAAVLPDRGGKVKLKKPPFVAHDRRANGYWNQIVKRLEGLSLLDDLDSEMLAGYCSMLSRRDQYILLMQQINDRVGVSAAAEEKKRKKESSMTDQEWEDSARAPTVLSADELAEAAAKADALAGKLQTLDRNLLQYAEKLGLTPSGRVRLAQKRAAQVEVDPDGDLYGD